jgi:ankyrin repeat protein
MRKSKTRKQKKQYGGGILQEAVESNNLDKVKELIAQGVDVNEKDSYGSTVLSTASANGYTDIVNELLKVNGIDINAQDTLVQYTALINAIMFKHYDIVNKLLDRNDINVNLVGFDGTNALTQAVIDGNIDIVNKILSKPDVNVNLQIQNGETALMRAIMFKKTDIAKLLLDRPDINVNLRTDFNITALMRAVETTNKDIVEKILSIPGVDINAYNNFNETALTIANRVLRQARLITRANAQQIQTMLVAAGATERQIIQPAHVNAMQVHTAFKKVKVNEFLNFMKEKVGDKNADIPKTGKEMSDYIKTKLDSFIKTNNNGSIKTNLNAIYNRHIKNTTDYTPTERQLFFYTLEYVSEKQNDAFKQMYVSSFAEDCAKAYNPGNTANTMSCGGGVKERIILSLEPSISSVGMTPEYKKILYYIDSTRYSQNTNNVVTEKEYNRLINQFGSVCIANNPTKEKFMNCMKDKLQEELRERYNQEEVITKLSEYANATGYFNNSSGGRRTIRKKYKFNKYKKTRKINK